MKNRTKLFGIIAFVVIIIFGMAACGSDGDSDNSGSGVATYKWAGSGLTSSEWNLNFIVPGIATNPSELINKSFTVTERNTAYEMIKADNAGNKGSGDTASDLKTGLTGFYDATFANAVVAKLEAQGWVYAATTLNPGPGDYVDIFIAIKE